MTEEVHINNEAVDLSEDTSLVLNFKSNIFGDLSKITSSNSLTIRLKKNTRNRRKLDNPTAPSYISSFPYKRHPAKYYRKGVEVIKTAYAVLLPSGADYETALYWGVMANFQSWVDKSASIRDLRTGLSVIWSNDTPLSAYPPTEGAVIADYDCGVGTFGTLPDLAKSQVAIHPSVRFSWLLSQISIFAGVKFEFPAEVQTQLELLAMPIIDRNANIAPTVSCEFTNVTRKTYANFTFGGFRFSGSQSDSAFYSIQEGTIYPLAQPVSCTTLKFKTAGNASIQLNFVMAVYLTSITNQTIIRVMHMRDGQSTGGDINISHTKSSAGGDVYHLGVSGPNGAKSLSVEEGDEIAFYVRVTDGDVTATFPDGTHINGWVNITTPDGDVKIQLGDRFPLVQNLPDIKQIDFIKAICGMFGLFAMQSKTDVNTIHFATVDEIIDNIPSAADWSSALVNSNDDEPSEVSRAIDGFAQHNYMEYKDDDTVINSGNGDLTVADDTLDVSRTAITLPFAASDGNLIPHYKWNDDNTKVDEQKVQPRVMRIVNGNGKCTLTFDELDFDTIIAKYYDTYSQVINEAIQIKEDLRLDEYTLRDLDYLRPVYLKKYGQYFAIKQIQLKKNVATADLIRIKRFFKHIKCEIVGRVNSAGVIIFSADYAVASDVTILFSYSNEEGYRVRDSAVLARGTSSLTTTIVTTSIEIISVSPTSDEIFRYSFRHGRPLNGIGLNLNVGDSILYAVADAPVASDIVINYQYYLIGEPNPIPATATMPKGSASFVLMIISRQFQRGEITAISPYYDDEFDYVIR
jgi:hypothetical protein